MAKKRRVRERSSDRVVVLKSDALFANTGSRGGSLWRGGASHPTNTLLLRNSYEKKVDHGGVVVVHTCGWRAYASPLTMRGLRFYNPRIRPTGNVLRDGK